MFPAGRDTSRRTKTGWCGSSSTNSMGSDSIRGTWCSTRSTWWATPSTPSTGASGGAACPADTTHEGTYRVMSGTSRGEVGSGGLPRCTHVGPPVMPSGSELVSPARRYRRPTAGGVVFTRVFTRRAAHGRGRQRLWPSPPPPLPRATSETRLARLSAGVLVFPPVLLRTGHDCPIAPFAEPLPARTHFNQMEHAQRGRPRAWCAHPPSPPCT